jgi:hypothetical protein
MRLIAQRLEHQNPSWIVLYGTYSKEFVAFPRFTAPRGTIVATRDASALPSRLRSIEEQAGQQAPSGGTLPR